MSVQMLTNDDGVEVKQVLNEDGIVLAEVEISLLRDYFDEIMIQDQKPFDALSSYKPSSQIQLVSYLSAFCMESSPDDIPSGD